MRKSVFGAVIVCMLAIFSTQLISGCGVSGHYQSDGPCKGFHKDQTACQSAAENSSAIGNVNLGQSTEEVREIMGKGPERREADKDTEKWGYLTNYRGYLYTYITFKNNAVVKILSE